MTLTQNDRLTAALGAYAERIAVGRAEHEEALLAAIEAFNAPEPEEAPEPETTGPRYPEVEVTLVGEDSNAFFIIGRVQRALRKAKVPDAEITRFAEEATAGDYDNVIATAMRWVSVR